MGLSFTTVTGSRQRSHSQVRILQDSWPCFTVSDSRIPQLGGPGLRICTLQNIVARSYPQALVSLFVASCDSQGCGGCTRPRLHPDIKVEVTLFLAYSISARTTWRTQFFYCFSRICCCRSVFTEPLTRNVSDVFANLAVVA
jgi:hypothetical protein